MGPFYDVISVIAIFVRSLGLLVFGVAGGWLILKIMDQAENTWQLQGILLVVFFGFLSFMAHTLPGGALGALMLGIAGGLIFWGMVKRNQESEEE